MYVRVNEVSAGSVSSYSSWTLTKVTIISFPGTGDQLQRYQVKTIEELDFAAAHIQFRNPDSGQWIVLRPNPQGGGSLVGATERDPTPWYFYRAADAQQGNFDVKREPIARFNWANYNHPPDGRAFIAWNHATRIPSATTPAAPHDWTLEEATNGLFRVRYRDGEYLELVPDQDPTSPRTSPRRPITRARNDASPGQLWELWAERTRGSCPDRKGLHVDPNATGWITSLNNDGYVTMLVGLDRPATLTDALGKPLTDALVKERVGGLDCGIQDIVDIVGFPRFPPWSDGLFLNWVALNTGIPGATMQGEDGTKREGGWGGYRWGHYNFESTPRNPRLWNDYESNGALHECIHALQSEQRKYNNEGSGWLHEAHNNFLATLRQKKVFARNVIQPVGALMAPHAPVESFGLLKDGTVAGPEGQIIGREGSFAANNNDYENAGYRYDNELFFLSLYLDYGYEFVLRLWTSAPAGNSKSLFHVMATNGPANIIENVLMSHGARAALLDYGDWTAYYRRKLRESWETFLPNRYYTFPQAPAAGAYSPPDLQRPFQQGRNIIPLAVSPQKREVHVTFNPAATGTQSTPAELRAQLVYRTLEDRPIYGPRASSGRIDLTLPTEGVRSNLVFLIVGVVNGFRAESNASYGYKLNERFTYTFTLDGATIAPTTTTPW